MSDSEEKTKPEKDVFDFDEKAEKTGTSDVESPIGAPEDVVEEKKSKTTRRKRKSILKDVNAPKVPLTSFFRFMNDQREKCREENPDIAPYEVNKMLGQKWSTMSADEKQRYHTEAEKEREAYVKAKEDYEKSDAYKQFQKLKRKHEAEEDVKVEQSSKRSKSSRSKQTTPKTPAVDEPVAEVIAYTPGPRISVEGSQIPIFTEHFLEYNRKREADLRQLRKHNAVYEEQNAVLNKQIDHMKSVMDSVKTEIIEQDQQNHKMQNFLEKIRGVLTEKFGKISYPAAIRSVMKDKGDGVDVDAKLAKLAEYLSTTKGEEAADLKKKVKEVMSSIDYPALKK